MLCLYCLSLGSEHTDWAMLSPPPCSYPFLPRLSIGWSGVLFAPYFYLVLVLLFSSPVRPQHIPHSPHGYAVAPLVLLLLNRLCFSAVIWLFQTDYPCFCLVFLLFCHRPVWHNARTVFTSLRYYCCSSALAAKALNSCFYAVYRLLACFAVFFALRSPRLHVLLSAYAIVSIIFTVK